MGKPRQGISLLLARFFLRPFVPSHLSCGQTSQPARHDSVFHLCRIEESHFCSVFRKSKSHSFLSGKMSSEGDRVIRPEHRIATRCLQNRQYLDFSKAVTHIINTPKDNS